MVCLPSAVAYYDRCTFWCWRFCFENRKLVFYQYLSLFKENLNWIEFTPVWWKWELDCYFTVNIPSNCWNVLLFLSNFINYFNFFEKVIWIQSCTCTTVTLNGTMMMGFFLKSLTTCWPLHTDGRMVRVIFLMKDIMVTVIIRTTITVYIYMTFRRLVVNKQGRQSNTTFRLKLKYNNTAFIAVLHITVVVARVFNN